MLLGVWRWGMRRAIFVFSSPFFPLPECRTDKSERFCLGLEPHKRSTHAIYMVVQLRHGQRTGFGRRRDDEATSVGRPCWLNILIIEERSVFAGCVCSARSSVRFRPALARHLQANGPVLRLCRTRPRRSGVSASPALRGRRGAGGGKRSKKHDGVAQANTQHQHKYSF